MNNYVVEFGVHGAYRISRREFATREAAIARAERHGRSNSTGHYWAVVSSPSGHIIREVNLRRGR